MTYIVKITYSSKRVENKVTTNDRITANQTFTEVENQIFNGQLHGVKKLELIGPRTKKRLSFKP